jgi:glycosyltransferase involved in cell wall biosynthesis
MRLAILGTRGIPARYGGFETFAEELATGLTVRGFDVTVFCEAGGTPAPATYEGVTLRYVSAPALGPLQTILYDLRCLWATRTGYDVVYMLGYGAAPFCLIPRLWGTPVWINPDGLEWARAKWGLVAKTYFRLMEWTCLRTANRIVADAHAIETSLASRHGKLSCCTVIPYGCEVIEVPPSEQLLSPWQLTPGSYYIVVCRHEPENHVLEILEGFQRSATARQLVVVGNHLLDNSYGAQLRAVSDPRIHFIGAVYDRESLTALRYHSFGYVHGHSVGGTNPSLLEAMGCGNLILAHDNPFNRETLDENGLFFQDSSQLATLFHRVEEGSLDLKKLREGARLRARTCYQWPDIVDRYARLLIDSKSAEVELLPGNRGGLKS